MESEHNSVGTPLGVGRALLILLLPWPALASLTFIQFILHAQDFDPLWPLPIIALISLVLTFFSQRSFGRTWDHRIEYKISRWIFLIAGLSAGPLVEIFLM